MSQQIALYLSVKDKASLALHKYVMTNKLDKVVNMFFIEQLAKNRHKLPNHVDAIPKLYVQKKDIISEYYPQDIEKQLQLILQNRLFQIEFSKQAVSRTSDLDETKDIGGMKIPKKEEATRDSRERGTDEIEKIMMQQVESSQLNEINKSNFNYSKIAGGLDNESKGLYIVNHPRNPALTKGKEKIREIGQIDSTIKGFMSEFGYNKEGHPEPMSSTNVDYIVKE